MLDGVLLHDQQHPDQWPHTDARATSRRWQRWLMTSTCSSGPKPRRSRRGNSSRTCSLPLGTTTRPTHRSHWPLHPSARPFTHHVYRLTRGPSQRLAFAGDSVSTAGCAGGLAARARDAPAASGRTPVDDVDERLRRRHWMRPRQRQPRCLRRAPGRGGRRRGRGCWLGSLDGSLPSAGAREAPIPTSGVAYMRFRRDADERLGGAAATPGRLGSSPRASRELGCGRQLDESSLGRGRHLPRRLHRLPRWLSADGRFAAESALPFFGDLAHYLLRQRCRADRRRLAAVGGGGTGTAPRWRPLLLRAARSG